MRANRLKKQHTYVTNIGEATCDVDNACMCRDTYVETGSLARKDHGGAEGGLKEAKGGERRVRKNS